MFVRRRPMMRAAATTAVVAGTATAVSGRVSRRQQARTGQSGEAASAPQQAPAPPPPPAPAAAPAPPTGLSDEAIDQLSKLGALHEQGVLTDDEFAAQKARLLGM